MLIRTVYKMKPPVSARINRGHFLARGLVGYWLMNEGSGLKVFDSSGNRLTGDLIVSPTWVVGRFGPALAFGGPASGDYIKLGTDIWSDADLVCGTLIVWCKLSDPAASVQQRIVSIEGVVRIVFDEDYADNFQSVLFDGVDRNLDSGVTPIADTWYQLGMTWNGTKVKLFVNAVEKASGNAGSPSLGAVNRPLAIGSSFGGSSNLYGAIDHVLIWNRDLSGSEFALLHRKPFCMFTKRSLFRKLAVRN